MHETIAFKCIFILFSVWWTVIDNKHTKRSSHSIIKKKKQWWTENGLGSLENGSKCYFRLNQRPMNYSLKIHKLFISIY